MLTERLRACADYVTGERVCDIGTDHAYLVAELLTSGRCKTAVAADINPGPLAAARETLTKAGVLDRTEIILSDGLQNVPENGITDIVIAGMGGELIAEILSECDWLRGKNLVLQPMTRSDRLIRWLCEKGFGILSQRAVLCGGFCYTVINAAMDGTPAFTPEPLFCMLGKLDLSEPAAKEYANRLAKRLRDEGTASGDTEKISLAEDIYKKISGI